MIPGVQGHIAVSWPLRRLQVQQPGHKDGTLRPGEGRILLQPAGVVAADHPPDLEIAGSIGRKVLLPQVGPDRIIAPEHLQRAVCVLCRNSGEEIPVQIGAGQRHRLSGVRIPDCQVKGIDQGHVGLSRHTDGDIAAVPLRTAPGLAGIAAGCRCGPLTQQQARKRRCQKLFHLLQSASLPSELRQSRCRRTIFNFIFYQIRDEEA